MNKEDRKYLRLWTKEEGRQKILRFWAEEDRMYCRAEEFRSVKFFVYTEGKQIGQKEESG